MEQEKMNELLTMKAMIQEREVNSWTYKEVI